MIIKSIIIGFFIAITHFLISIALSVYIGFGLLKSWMFFLENVVWQPATFAFYLLNYEPSGDRDVFVFNMLFYWIISSLIAMKLTKKTNPS